MPATLFHAPLACSLAVRIAAAEGEVPLRLKQVNLTTKQVEGGGDFRTINPLGQVSVLVLETGTQITETSACLLWVQAQSRVEGFHRSSDMDAYFQMLRWIGFCATELHKQIFRIVFYPEATKEVKARIRALAPERFAYLDHHLIDRPYLLGETFSAADAYLIWALTLAERAEIDPSVFAHLEAYRVRALQRPAIKEIIADDRCRAEAG